ncbi:MAG TPA: hypothetical protein G4O17_05915 [Dehalococcoidia bacterium]|nr:hypothetical protein [Dehalococcoidia bacterium]
MKNSTVPNLLTGHSRFSIVCFFPGKIKGAISRLSVISRDYEEHFDFLRLLSICLGPIADKSIVFSDH